MGFVRNLLEAFRGEETFLIVFPYYIEKEITPYGSDVIANINSDPKSVRAAYKFLKKYRKGE